MRVPLIPPLLAAVAFACAPASETPEPPEYTVRGTLTIRNIDCEVDIPDRVRVHAGLFKGENFVGIRVRDRVFPSNGPFEASAYFDLGEPDGWRIIDVTRVDGSRICTREDSCGDDRLCLNMAGNPRHAAIGVPIDWRTECKCMSAE